MTLISYETDLTPRRPDRFFRFKPKVKLRVFSHPKMIFQLAITWFLMPEGRGHRQRQRHRQRHRRGAGRGTGRDTGEGPAEAPAEGKPNFIGGYWRIVSTREM